MSIRSFMQSEPFHFWSFSILLMATAGSFAYFWEELSAPSDVRRERFDREVLRGNKLVPPKAEQIKKENNSLILTTTRRKATANAREKTSPWNMIFDLRERETYWTDENKARLVKIVAKKSLDIPLAELQFRLDAVLAIIPDLDQRIVTMHPDNLAALLRNPEAAATALLQLRRLLPLVNVSALAAKAPSLLDSDVIASLPKELTKLERLLGVQPPGALPEGDVHSAETFAAAITAQPLLLDSEGVEEALEELQRLMPGGTDVHAMLMRNPDYILRVQRGQKRIGLNPDSFPDSSYIDVQVPKLERND